MKALSSPWPQFAGFLRPFERVLRVTADHPLRVGRNPFGEAPVLPQLYGGGPSGKREKDREERSQRPSRSQSMNSAHEPDARQPASAPAWRQRTSQRGSQAHQRASA